MISNLGFWTTTNYRVFHPGKTSKNWWVQQLVRRTWVHTSIPPDPPGLLDAARHRSPSASLSCFGLVGFFAERDVGSVSLFWGLYPPIFNGSFTNTPDTTRMTWNIFKTRVSQRTFNFHGCHDSILHFQDLASQIKTNHTKSFNNKKHAEILCLGVSKIPNHKHILH